MGLDEQREDRLDRLFAAYREAVADPEPSARFMPGMWERIESRRRDAWRLRRWAGGLVTASAAICTVVAVMLLIVPAKLSIHPTTYVDVLGNEEEIAFLIDWGVAGEDVNLR